MQTYRIQIKRGQTVRREFEAMAEDSCAATMQHADLCEPGEKLDVQLIPLLPMPTPNDRRALLNQIAAMDAGLM
mgnify:CR=1 FL=1|jgi:hypothetical protein